MDDVLVEQVVLQTGERSLDLDELLLGIALKGDEEEPSRQLAEAVRSVDEVVAPAQQLGALVEVGVREADMRLHVHDRSALIVLLVEVDLGELVSARQWAARSLRAPDDLLLAAERLTVPRLDAHVDLARD